MPVKTDREYRRMETLEARDADSGEKIVEGYACTFDQEYTLYDYGSYAVKESIDRHAFDECDMGDVIMQYDHQGRVFARTGNGTLTLSADEHGLHMRGDLGGTEGGRQLYDEIRGGYTTKMSFGFTVKSDEITDERDNETGKLTKHRKITRIKKLYDVSAVSLPANDATEISARNLCDGWIKEIEEERLVHQMRQRTIQKIRIMMEVET